MELANPHRGGKGRMVVRKSFIQPLLVFWSLLLAVTLSLAQPARPAPPDEAQIKRDVWGDGKGKIKAELTAGKSGEFLWDERTRTWTFQRGFIVTRKGDLAGFPDADLEVGGLAVYRNSGQGWMLQKLLTTFNRYSGIPAPSDEELLALARSNADHVFRAKVRDMPNGLEQLTLSQDQPTRWHNANSLSFYLNASYPYRVPSNGRVAPCTSLWEVRIYRDNPSAPWRNPVGMYKKIVSGCMG